MAITKGGLRFRVFVNGRAVCTSGMRGYGVLDVILTRVRRNPSTYPGKKAHPLELSKAAWSKERIDLHVGGLDTNGVDQYLHWLRHDVKIGDEISIRLLPEGEYDSPKGAHRRLTPRPTRTR